MTILYKKKYKKERDSKNLGQIKIPASHPTTKGIKECVLGNHPHNTEKVYDKITNRKTMVDFEPLELNCDVVIFIILTYALDSLPKFHQMEHL